MKPTPPPTSDLLYDTDRPECIGKEGVVSTVGIGISVIVGVLIDLTLWALWVASEKTTP